MIDFERYIRQLPLFENGGTDQEELLSARVTVVGAGGLGCSCLIYLAAAGVGYIQIVDYQSVEHSNLNRQILYEPADIGSMKAAVAAEKLARFNPDITVQPISASLAQARRAVLEFSPRLIIDCTDSMEARFEINRLSLALRIPAVFAMVEGFQFMTGTVYPGETACFACVFSSKASSASPPPVIGVTPGTAGIIEAAVAVQILLGKKPLAGKILNADLKSMSFEFFRTNRRSDCPVCKDYA